jgi:FAD/FMN-containing dehydrogenase
LSYLTGQYGFASDNVVNFEAVLANGTIVNANASSHPDLYWALRGGGNAADQYPALFAAVTDFVANNTDPKAAVIPTLILLGPANVVDISTVFFFYDGATPAGAFAAFDAIPSLLDTRETQRYPQLLDVPLTGDTGFSTAIAMQTFPNLPHGDMVSFLEQHWGQASDAALLRSLTSLDVQLFSVALQPMPAMLQRASASSPFAPSPLTPDPSAGDKIWIEYDIEWLGAPCDSACPAALRTLITDGLAHETSAYGSGTPPTNYVAGNASWTSYNPLFMNDAAPWEDVLGSYGAENYARLEAVHESVDPDGFLTGRQQGFSFGE